MSGELILKNNNRWRRTLPAVAVTTLITFVFLWLMHILLSVSGTKMEGGVMEAILIALMTYVVFRSFYPLVTKYLPGGEKTRTLSWTMTGDDLILGSETIPLDNIKMVHCWPQKDALGHRLQGWIINIETRGAGKNQVLCSVDEGEQVERSVELLQELVDALGYHDRWVEE